MLKNRSHELSRQLAADIHMYCIIHNIYLFLYINIIQLSFVGHYIGTRKITR